MIRVISLAAALAIVAAPAAAQAPPDLAGVWWPVQPEGADFKPNPPLTQKAQAEWDGIRASLAAGKVVQDSTAACVPPGTPRLMTRVYPIQWVRYPKGYLLVHEYENAVRWIYMDGRKAPIGDDLTPTFNGYSVGHWEEGALVVETTGFKDRSESGLQVWIQLGVRTTPTLKLTERYRLTDGGKGLDVELTLADPAVFARPWGTHKRYQLRPEVEIMEFTCLPDENPITFKPDGSTGFKDLAGQ